MNQALGTPLKQNWQLKSRSIYIHVPIFKIKLHQPNQSPNPYIFFHLPQVKKVVAYTPDLKTLLKTYRFPQDPHAFQIMNITPKDQPSRPYIVAGSTAGTIMCQSLAPKPSQQQSNSVQNDIFCLNNTDKDLEQNYVNQVLSIGNNKIANCFNNGTIAFWDLDQARKLHSLPKVHESYTYKLRKIDQRLISCGHDNMTVVTDLIKVKPFTFLRNPDSCWCSTPLNYNIVTSVGLFDRVNIWDVRTRQLVQSAQLQNGETSFVTVFDNNNLVLGDGPELKKCDLRTMRCNRFASESMLGSAESIIVTERGGYVCGRRFEMCHFSSVEVANHNVPSISKILNPFTQGDMFMYETMFNQNRQEPQQQDEQQQELDEQQQMEGQIQMGDIFVIPNNEDIAEMDEQEMAYHEFIGDEVQQGDELVINGDQSVEGVSIEEEKQAQSEMVQEQQESGSNESEKQDQIHSINDFSSQNQESDS